MDSSGVGSPAKARPFSAYVPFARGFSQWTPFSAWMKTPSLPSLWISPIDSLPSENCVPNFGSGTNFVRSLPTSRHSATLTRNNPFRLLRYNSESSALMRRETISGSPWLRSNRWMPTWVGLSPMKWSLNTPCASVLSHSSPSASVVIRRTFSSTPSNLPKDFQIPFSRLKTSTPPIIPTNKWWGQRGLVPRL